MCWFQKTHGDALPCVRSFSLFLSLLIVCYGLLLWFYTLTVRVSHIDAHLPARSCPSHTTPRFCRWPFVRACTLGLCRWTSAPWACSQWPSLRTASAMPRLAASPRAKPCSLPVHTLTCCTHIFLRTSARLHACAHTRVAQVPETGSLHVCHISPSRLLPSHVSFILAVPWRSLRDHSRLRPHRRSRPHVLAVLTRPKSAGHAPLRTCIAKFGYLTKSDANTGYDPKKFGKNTSVDDDTTLINDPDQNTSDFSKTMNENTSQFGVHTVFESSVLHVSHSLRWWCNRETVARQRKKNEKVLWSVQSRCQRKVNGTVLVWVWRVTENPVLESLRKFYSDERDLREHLERRARQAIIGENSIQRKLYLNEYKMEIQNLKRRNSEDALTESQRELESRRQLLLEINCADQAQRSRIYLCGRLVIKDHLHQECYARRSCREIEELKRCCCREENTENNKDWKNFIRSMIRNHGQWVYSSTILTYWAVMTYQRSSSSSYYLEFKEAWSRSWNAAKYTRENEYSWKRFWLSTWSTRSWWIIQSFKRFGNTISNRWWCRGFWEKKELRIVVAKNHCNQYIYLAFQQERGEKVQTTNKPSVFD